MGRESSFDFVSEPGHPSRENHVRVYFSQPPRLLRWGLMFGDFVHNLRTALDQIVWHFASREVRAPKRTTAFPVYIDPDKYAGTAPFGGRQAGIYKIKDISDPEVRALIEGVQPYHASDGYQTSALYWVQEFDATDKHQVIVPAAITPVQGETIVRTGDVTGPLTATAHPGPLIDGADVLIIVSEQEVEVGVDPKLTIAITLDVAGTPWEMTHLCEMLFAGTIAAVELFQPLIV
jgi:hypothetical protein